MAHIVQCPQGGRADRVCHCWNQLGISFQKTQKSLCSKVMMTIIITVVGLLFCLFIFFA